MTNTRADELAEVLAAEGWQRPRPTDHWRYYAGVEVYEIQLHVAGGAILHASLWDLTGPRQLVATAYRAWPVGVRLQEIRRWISDPAAITPEPAS
ncbi:hypothetical protein SEA_PUPPERS_47 [Gordonia phage Puppers]|nr:hypothetical protein SEA_PUPPERS_47 [Gordonia phage Puppers]